MRFPHCLVVLTAFLAPVAVAQEVHWNLHGLSQDERFGTAVAGSGDINGDGFDDLIIGSPHETSNGMGAGRVMVVSGLNGTLLYLAQGSAPSAFLGASVSMAGDVDNDGFPDFAMGAPGDYRMQDPPGRVRVVSGATGQDLFVVVDASGSEQLGVAVSDAGDADGDGFDDILIGAARRQLAGGALLISGQTGLLIRDFVGEQPFDYFGLVVSSAGDVDGDGIEDHVIGGNGGYAKVYRGVNGALHYTSRRGFPGDRYGTSLDEIGDLDGDGRSDLVIGAVAGNDGTGQVFVISGRFGELLHLLEGDAVGEQFGIRVSGAGDLNDDGDPDWLVARPLAVENGSTVGGVRAFSGADGGVLYNWIGDTFEFFGAAIAGAGDLNGDGLADVAVGAPQADTPFLGNAGRVTTFLGNDLFLEADPSHPASGETLTLTARQNTPTRPALLAVVSINGAPGFQLLSLGTFDFQRQFRLSGQIPPGLSGMEFGVQAFTRHPQGHALDSSILLLTIP